MSNKYSQSFHSSKGTNLDSIKFDGGSALDWNSSKLHLQNNFAANECWEYINPPDIIPEDPNLIIENVFLEPEPQFTEMVTDRMEFLRNSINQRLDDKEALLINLHLNAAAHSLEMYRITSEREQEIFKVEQSRDSLTKDYNTCKDSWRHRKERHLLIQSKCMKVFINNLGESAHTVIKDLLKELKFRAAWILLAKT